jgi:hypothetical protein
MTTEMRTRNAIRMVLTLLALLALAASFAGAVTITEFAWYPTPNGPTVGDTPRTLALTDWNGVTQDVTLAQFDPSLGTLNSVTLTLYSDVDSGGNVKNNSAGPITVNQYDAFMQTEILAPGTSVPATSSTPYLLSASPTLISVAPQTLGVGDSVTFSVVESSASTTQTYTTGLGAYEGTGNLVFPLFTRTRTVTDLTGGDLDLTQTTDLRSEAIIVYDYTEPGVPEPASMVLMVSGLVGLGLVSRKRFAR